MKKSFAYQLKLYRWVMSGVITLLGFYAHAQKEADVYPQMRSFISSESYSSSFTLSPKFNNDEIAKRYPALAAKPLPDRTFNINALGLLQFGPILQAEYKVAERSYIAPHVRIPYLGILYHVINADDRSDEVTASPAALGIGVGYKYFVPVEKGAWYVGGGGEYSFGSSKGNDGKEWKSEFSNVALMSNGGFRWRWTEKKNVLSVGAYLGIYSALRDEWWYVSSPARKNDERSTTAMFMLELAFGWER